MSTDRHLIEDRIDGEAIFDGRLLKVRRDTVRLPDGGTATREYIIHPGAVVVVPLLDDGRVIVERQFRYPVGKVMTEFPAGKLEPGEDPLLCAVRELAEETGYTAREWARAGQMHLAIAYSTEIIHIYFARGLVPGRQALDVGEHLDVSTATPDELMRWAREGELSDAKSMTCLTWLQNVLSGAWTLDWRSAP